MLKTYSTADLTVRSEGSFRGPKQITHRSGSITGRRYWMRKCSKQPRNYDPGELLGLEVIAESHLTYNSLAPQRSSFAAVTEACLLNAPIMDKEDDIRANDPVFLKYQKSKTTWGDPNYGPLVSMKLPRMHGKNKTVKYGIDYLHEHRDGQLCRECLNERPRPIKRDEELPNVPKPIAFHSKSCKCDVCYVCDHCGAH